MPLPFSVAELTNSLQTASFEELANVGAGTKPFDPSFGSRLPKKTGYDWDALAKGPAKKCLGPTLASCDACCLGLDGLYYFIEFKNQREQNIIAAETRNKVFGSLLLASLTIANHETMHDLMEKSVFVVVFPNQNYLDMIGYDLSKLAAPGSIPLWNLDKLESAGVIRKAHTVTDADFSKLPLLQQLP